MSKPKSLYFTMAWRLFLDVASRGTFFLVNIVIARALGVVEFGKFAYATSFSVIFYSFTELGTNLQLAKELGENSDPEKSSWKHFFELKLLLLLACLLIAGPISIAAWHWPHAWIPVAALVWMLSNSMLDFNQFTCNGMKRMDLAQNMMLLHRGTVVLGTLIAVALSRTLESVIIGMALGGVTGALLSNSYFFRFSKRSAAWAGVPSEWKRILKLSIPTGFAGTLGQTVVRIGPVLLAWVWTSQIVGEYSAAFRIFEISYVVPAAVMAISVPHLSEALRKGRTDFTSQLMHVFVVMMPIALAWTALLYFGSPLIVRTLFGAKFLNAAPVLKIFSGVSFLVFVNYTVTNIMVIIGWQRRHALNTVLMFLLAICYFALLVGKGAVGIALAMLLCEATMFVLTARALWAWWRLSNE